MWSSRPTEVLMGMLFGAMGVVISVPLAAATLVFVRCLYVEDVLERGEEPEAHVAPITDL